MKKQITIKSITVNAKTDDGMYIDTNHNYYYDIELGCGNIILEPTDPYGDLTHLELTTGDIQKLKKVNYITDNLIFCDDCGQAWDSEDLHYGNSDVMIVDCAAYCKECLTAEEVLIELNEVKDVFESRNVQDIETDGFIKVAELFCDNSGMGASYERAKTKTQTEYHVQKVMEENKGVQLYVGLTGISQFQVYVGIFKKGK